MWQGQPELSSRVLQQTELKCGIHSEQRRSVVGQPRFCPVFFLVSAGGTVVGTPGSQGLLQHVDAAEVAIQMREVLQQQARLARAHHQPRGACTSSGQQTRPNLCAPPSSCPLNTTHPDPEHTGHVGD